MTRPWNMPVIASGPERSNGAQGKQAKGGHDSLQEKSAILYHATFASTNTCAHHIDRPHEAPETCQALGAALAAPAGTIRHEQAPSGTSRHRAKEERGT